MGVSTLFSLLSLASFAFSQTLNASLASPKRGLVYVAPKSPKDNDYWASNTSDLTWYYNYQATPTAAFKGSDLQFVPMLWGQPLPSQNFTANVTSLIAAGQNITAVLAFNEPDGCYAGGSCLSAANASAIWQAQIEPLKKLGIRLGAPAVTGAQTGFAWLQAFFTACAGNCHPDFLPVHWYGDFQGLASHIGQVNATYGVNMTVWVTEFAEANATLQASQSFYNQSVAFMDGWDYIERYSYFGAFRSPVSNIGYNATMLDQNGNLTDIGAWYLGEDATGNIPEASGVGKTGRFMGWSLFIAAVMFYEIL